MNETIFDALPSARIVRVTRRVAGVKHIDVGQAWSCTPSTLRIRELTARRYVDLPLSEVTAVEIIGLYLKDYGS
ncbi:hypothetical protein [Corynebacterium nasicanis]|uniref:Uncharacterized protein n=1 Tax=Corynebacterium nasicanis TaxID=1448267 RepID=A0ABW1QD16_9CORY